MILEHIFGRMTTIAFSPVAMSHLGIFRFVMFSLLLGGIVAGPAMAQAEAVDLGFGELFRQPVGPRGLEPTPKLLGLAGKRVRLTGYLMRTEGAATGVALLAPRPLLLGDGDEGLADDLPASTVTVLGRVADGLPENVRLRLSGVLDLAPRLEADGRISFIRLLVDKAEIAPRP